ncbi:hypothetical protein GCM10023331_37140 [Algivirga pacifica]|uniref:Tyr recombinase domain-containing protein n=1 Tax=Algivirga pacifica TaxID=1162670 RepID=A0ABP9DKS3_9BACT
MIDKAIYKYDKRTFSTPAVSLGLSDELIRAVTGHKDQKSFASYVRISGEQKRKKALEVK